MAIPMKNKTATELLNFTFLVRHGKYT